MKYNNLTPLWGFIIMVVLAIGFFIFVANGEAQEKQDPPPYESWYDSLAMIQAKEEAVEKEEPAPVKTWKLPDYMRENLQRELDDFNKRFEAKVQAYKKELKTRFAEFKDMPDDAILYLEGGIFITRSDFQKLQNQLRDKLKQEVKGDDKTTN